MREKYQIRGTFKKADFYRICKAENIRLIKSDAFYTRIKGIRGFILTVKGRRYIYLRSLHHSRFDIFMAMHELGHYFLRHSGINYKMMKDGSFAVDIQEFEANLFAELTTKTEAKNAQN